MIEHLKLPMDVPEDMCFNYRSNYEIMTHGTGRLMLMAGDQKVEHLNDDFFGPDIAPEDASPEHLFKIADQGKIGVFAVQMGLVSSYGMDYPQVPYLLKLNSKTNLLPTSQRDPLSTALWNMEQVAQFKKYSGLNILGVGYTIYPGSEFEHIMLAEAVGIIHAAHQMGMIAIIWAYPRGRAVADEKDIHLVAGAAGVAACLGADFVKVNYPVTKSGGEAGKFKEVVAAAGRTGVICAGGSHAEVKSFIARLHDQIHIAGVAGNATGRNIHQRPLDEAVRLCEAIYAVTIDNKSVDKAMAIYHKNTLGR